MHTSKQLNNVFTISLAALALSGCQLNKLPENNGNGALLLLVAIEKDGKEQYPCRSVSMEVAGEERSFHIDVDRLENEDVADSSNLHVGYGLFSNLPPAEYLVTELKCWPHIRHEFTGSGTSFFSFQTHLNFTIKPDTITVHRQGIRGSVYKRLDETSVFNIGTADFGTEGRDLAVDMLNAQEPDIDNWSIERL
ncbi:hypothetical protein V9N52_002830 [Vibrio navarrensis]